MANSHRKVFYCRAKSIKGLSLLSWRQKWLISRRDLVWTERKAIRGRVWFRILERVEGAIAGLAIRRVGSVRSARLEEIIARIIEELENAFVNNFDLRIERVGRRARALKGNLKLCGKPHQPSIVIPPLNDRKVLF